MKKILLILSLALIIPFTGISQKYAGVESLYAYNVNTIDDQEGDRAPYWLTWATAGAAYVYSFNNTIEFGPFLRFGIEDMEEYVGRYITRIRYYVGQSASEPTSFWAPPRVQIYLGGYVDESSFEYERGMLVFDYVHDGYKMGQNNITLPSAIEIPANTELWFGVIYYIETGYAVASVDYENPVILEGSYKPYKSDLIYVGEDDEFFSMTETSSAGQHSWIQAVYLEELGNCGTPTNLVVNYSEDCKSAELSWTAPSDNPDALYNIYRDNVAIKTGVDATSYIDNTPFNQSQPHTWGVRAVCKEEVGGGESVTLSENLGPCSSCSNPSNLSITYNGDCSVATLTWSKSDDAEKYEILRAGIKIAETTELTYTDNGGPFTDNTVWVVRSVCKLSTSTGVNISTACVGIRDNEITFSIAPNPATTEITIKAGNIFNTIEIVNFLGQKVISQNNSTDNVTIDVSQLNSGVYFVRIASENGVSVQKFVKK